LFLEYKKSTTLQSEWDEDKASGEKGVHHSTPLVHSVLSSAEDVTKMIRLRGDRARLDAKANNTYIVIVPDAEDSHNHA
jgi:hypothetical protein